MLKKILWGALLLFLAYNVLISIFPLHKNVFYVNKERAEEYLYNSRNFDVVTIGSSLIGGFEADSLSAGTSFFNLFFPFSGSCTGSALLRRSPKNPKIVLVEINNIARGADKNLLLELFEPIAYHVKYYVPCALAKNQLFNYVIDSFKPPKNENSNEAPPPPLLYNKLLKMTQAEWAQIPDSAYFHQSLQELGNDLTELQKRNCKIVFFEMPIDASLTNSKKAIYQRKHILEYFGEKKYLWIPLDTTATYQTGDGVHLLKKDLNKYMKYMTAQLKKQNVTLTP